jgi:transcriptional regulator with XRE-family HTH domain
MSKKKTKLAKIAFARGETIRMARTRMRMTQHELGQALDSLTTTTISRYETGTRMAPLMTVMAVRYLLLQHIRKILRAMRRGEGPPIQ